MKSSISRMIPWSGLLLLGCGSPPAIAPPRSVAPPAIDLVRSAGLETATFALG
jgi:hypothetical protein